MRFVDFTKFGNQARRAPLASLPGIQTVLVGD